MQTLTLMAVGFSARRGRSRANLLSVLALLVLECIGCSQSVRREDTVWLESTDKTLHFQNGLVYQANQPFTGAIFARYPATRDTMEVTRYLAGKEDGIWKKYYETGKLMEQREYAKGMKVGEYLAWWPNEKKNFTTDLSTTSMKVPARSGMKTGGWCRK